MRGETACDKLFDDEGCIAVARAEHGNLSREITPCTLVSSPIAERYAGKAL